MKVSIPGPLRSYTGQRSEVETDAATLADLLSGLDRRYPGLRFRIVTEQDTIRQHIKLFINEEPASHLAMRLKPDDHIHIICALSGG
ncbi:MAG: MoaD/ThiS family protein [Nitrospiraceae bacterium]